MLKPKRLQRGSHIQIVIPASPVRPEFFEAGFSALKDLGFQVNSPSDLYRKWRYLAGEDNVRRQEFLQALKDPQIDAIFFARGGYGSSRILLHPAEFRDLTPKILLGCSDITSLHLYFQQVHGWTVFHGPMAAGDFARGQVDLNSLEKALMQTATYELNPQIVETLIPGTAEGMLMGGCLSLIAASIGTEWEPDWQNCILYLEDVGVKPYQMDRMITQLKLAGKLNHVQAFVFGEMKDCVQIENQGYTLQEVIVELLQEFRKPVFFNFPSGHVSGMNWTLPFGVQARVTSEPHFSLQILEGAVQ